MKRSALIILCAAIAALALLVACQPEPDSVSETASCMDCHSGDSDIGNAVLAAQAQYDNSGHLKGPRTFSAILATGETETGHMYVFHGSNSMYANGSNCSKCHTHQGFVDFIDAGMPATWDVAYGAASPPGCFTCHKPHATEDFSTRKSSSETLIDGTTAFDGGAGNLCVVCHKSLTKVGSTTSTVTTDFFNTSNTWPKTWQTYHGTHHGPQAEFLMGINNYAYAAEIYFGESDHMDGLADSCVNCHMYAPAARESGSLEFGGHGMYMTGDVHGTNTNLTGVCWACHKDPADTSINMTGTATASLTAGFETNLPNPSTVNSYLDDIRTLRNRLIVYFGNGTTNFSGTGTGPIQGVDDGLDQTTGEWEREWEFASASLSADQSYAFWNFKFFIEDKSQGIHNPDFAFQILYDSAEALGLDVVTGITNARP